MLKFIESETICLPCILKCLSFQQYYHGFPQGDQCFHYLLSMIFWSLSLVALCLSDATMFLLILTLKPKFISNLRSLGECAIHLPLFVQLPILDVFQNVDSIVFHVLVLLCNLDSLVSSYYNLGLPLLLNSSQGMYLLFAFLALFLA
jgi:hypothetical protein